MPKVAEAQNRGSALALWHQEEKTLAFFAVHRELDVFHSDSTAGISERLSVDAEAAVEVSGRAAAALWKFLDQFPLQA